MKIAELEQESPVAVELGASTASEEEKHGVRVI
jgi:hypothetical protein